jgi:hypothetical protein
MSYAIEPTRRARRLCRGSAMTELVILIFPYAMIFIGVTVLGSLVLGKMQAQKASILAAAVPEEQDFEYVDDHAYLRHIENGGTVGTAEVEFAEEVGYSPPQDYATEEPVLPYESGQDLHAGFINLSYSAHASGSISGGRPTTNESGAQMNSIGQYLTDYGIMPDREEDLASVLGDWVTYSRARTEYRYAYGGSRLPRESVPDGGDLRGEFVLEQGGEEGIAYFSASRQVDPLTGLPITHGTHHDGSVFGEPEILFEALTGLETAPAGNESDSTAVIDLSQLPEPLMDVYGEATCQVLWDPSFQSNLPDYPSGLPIVSEESRNF